MQHNHLSSQFASFTYYFSLWHVNQVCTVPFSIHTREKNTEKFIEYISLKCHWNRETLSLQPVLVFLPVKVLIGMTSASWQTDPTGIHFGPLSHTTLQLHRWMGIKLTRNVMISNCKF